MKGRFDQDIPPSVFGGQRVIGMVAQQDRFPVVPMMYGFKPVRTERSLAERAAASYRLNRQPSSTNMIRIGGGCLRLIVIGKEGIAGARPGAKGAISPQKVRRQTVSCSFVALRTKECPRNVSRLTGCRLTVLYCGLKRALESEMDSMNRQHGEWRNAEFSCWRAVHFGIQTGSIG